MTSTSVKRIIHVPKLETFQTNGTDTYGDSYPLYAQWEGTGAGAKLKLKCDGYKVLADNINFVSEDKREIKTSEEYILDVSSVLNGKSIKTAIIYILSNDGNVYYALPYIESGVVKTWVHRIQGAQIIIKSSVRWADCQIYATIFTD